MITGPQESRLKVPEARQQILDYLKTHSDPISPIDLARTVARIHESIFVSQYKYAITSMINNNELLADERWKLTRGDITVVPNREKDHGESQT